MGKEGQGVDGQVTVGQEVGVVGEGVDGQITVGQEVGVVEEGVDVDIVGGLVGHTEQSFGGSCGMSPLSAE